MIFDPFLTLGYVEMIKVFLHPIDAVPCVPAGPARHIASLIHPNTFENFLPPG